MHKRFDHQEIEKKWQEKWTADKLYDVGERDESKEKEYVLVELPYPSGNLHIGHWYAFAVPDIYVRFKRMLGTQVIYPMGFDAFGLPAENAAIKRDLNPKDWTNSNISYMREQLASMGNAFSWDKTVNTTDPEYYKWTQWMFTQFFENDIAYRGEGIVNWDPVDNTVIANEQVLADGTSERSGAVVEKKVMPQWMMRTTDFADALIDDLDDLNWPEFIKESQRNWIGRSEGAEIDFTLSTGDIATVFTTRADTLFGATYLVIAPEHDIVSSNKDSIVNWAEVAEYIDATKKKAEQDRLDGTKEKTGVKLEGVTATNPANNEEIPVYVADYVLAGYGTGMVMAVPAHDERDHEFAKNFSIPIIDVVRKQFGEPLPDPVKRIAAGAVVFDPKTDKYLVQYSHEFEKYSLIYGGLEEGEDFKDAAVRETLEETGYKAKFDRYISGEEEVHFYHPGKKVNRHLIGRQVLLELIDDEQAIVSDEELAKAEPVWLTKEELLEKVTAQDDSEAVRNLFNPTIHTGSGTLYNSGEFTDMDSEEAKKAIVEKVGGRMTNTYRLRDWSVGRQRYWGVPIPIVYDPEGKAHIVPKEHLPWLLPEDVDFRPTGEPPLAKSEELKRRTEEVFGAGWTPEVETMDTFVDSSWYFLRYLDNTNDKSFSDIKKQNDWMPIDIYFGGAEHTTMHLLYSRFWVKALKKIGLTEINEPYTRRINRSLIMGPDGNKMSKSKGNVVDPDEQVERVGSDTVKMYLSFMGPYAEVNHYPFDLGGIAGIRRFLERVNGLSEHISEAEVESSTRLLHKTIKKVRSDVVEYKFNTAISAMMVFINHAEKQGLSKEDYMTFITLLAPFAPHLTEELWAEHHDTSVHLATYPDFDEALAKDDTVKIGVQINGKLRGDIEIAPDADQSEAENTAKSDENIAKRLEAGEVVKVIYVPGRILNFIIKEA